VCASVGGSCAAGWVTSAAAAAGCCAVTGQPATGDVADYRVPAGVGFRVVCARCTRLT
jgi:hypothetical protein